MRVIRVAAVTAPARITGGSPRPGRGRGQAPTAAHCMQAPATRENSAMARTVLIPGIREVHLPEARQAIPHVHAYLRECLLDGTLTPGTKLSQVTLAKQLGISRTPLREVLR